MRTLNPCASHARRAAMMVTFAALAFGQKALAQFPPGPPGPPPPPRASAPIDLTGTWVSVINEDWRWRMVTPPCGDFPGIPLNPAGRKTAESWAPATDGSCQAFGAAALLRTGVWTFAQR